MRKLTYTIYTIRDEDGAVRYVGLTTQPPKWRLQGHKQAKTRIGEWVRAEIESGRTVTLVIEEQICRDGFFWGHASRIEKQYINGYRRLLGDFLLNCEGPRKNKALVVAKAVPSDCESARQKRQALKNIA